MKLYGSSLEELNEQANIVKEQILLSLQSEGLLTKPAAKIGEVYAVVVSRPGVLGRLFRKIVGSTPDTMEVRIMKLT